MKITVLGAGAWGTALALVLVDNKNDVALWTYKTEQAEIMRSQHINPRLKDIPLPEELRISSDLSSVCDSDMIVMGTPSYTIRDMARKIEPLIREDAVIVPVSKGIERDTALCLTQVIEEELHGKGRLVVLSGPSHAEEVARRVPTGCA